MGAKRITGRRVPQRIPLPSKSRQAHAAARDGGLCALSTGFPLLGDENVLIDGGDGCKALNIVMTPGPYFQWAKAVGKNLLPPRAMLTKGVWATGAVPEKASWGPERQGSEHRFWWAGAPSARGLPVNPHICFHWQAGTTGWSMDTAPMWFRVMAKQPAD